MGILVHPNRKLSRNLDVAQLQATYVRVPLAKAILICEVNLVLLPQKPQSMIAMIDIYQASFLHCQGAL
jgi:hypothetical protein